MRYFGLTALFAILASCLMQVVIVSTYGWPSVPWPVEVLSHPRVSFVEEARRAIFYSPSLSKSKQPVIVIAGASAAQEGFQPRSMQAIIPELLTHNLSMGGANISEVDQIIEHVFKSKLAPEFTNSSALVLALSYAMFVPDQKRWRDPVFVPPEAIKQNQLLTDVAREALRCPHICNSDSFLFRTAPDWLVMLAKERYIYFQPVVRHLPAHPGDPLLRKSFWKQDPFNLHKSFSSNKKPSAGPATAPATPQEPYLVMAYRQMDFLTDYMGQPKGVLHDEQFDKLDTLIKKVRALGLRVVVIDMPLPSWHREKSPFFAPYQAKLQARMEKHLQDGGISYVELTAAIPDDEFRDSVHPSAEAAAHWAGTLIDSLPRPVFQAVVGRD